MSRLQTSHVNISLRSLFVHEHFMGTRRQVGGGGVKCGRKETGHPTLICHGSGWYLSYKVLPRARKGTGYPPSQCHGSGRHLSYKVLPRARKEAGYPTSQCHGSGRHLSNKVLPTVRKETGHPASQCHGLGWYLFLTRCSQGEEKNWPPYLIFCCLTPTCRHDHDARDKIGA